MFKSQFFKRNTNIKIIEDLNTFLRAQVCFENNILMDYTRNNLYFDNIHVIHVYMLIFQGELDLRHIRSARTFHKDPGVLRGQYTHGL